MSARCPLSWREQPLGYDAEYRARWGFDMSRLDDTASSLPERVAEYRPRWGFDMSRLG